MTVGVKKSLLALTAGAAVCAWGGPAGAAVTVAMQPSVMINEVSTSNFSGAADETGKREDWVELYNGTSAPVDLSGWGLSNTTKSPFKWVVPRGVTIPAYGYLRVWLSKNDRTSNLAHLHANFNLDNGADPIVLSAPNQTPLGVLIDSTTPPLSRPDVSWCRAPNGSPSGAFAFCTTPTPGAANAPPAASAMLATPVLSVPSGVYASVPPVMVTGPAGAELRYTLDGSEPTATSALVNGPVAIIRSASLRVAAFRAGFLPSFAETATYVLDTSNKFAGQRQVFITLSPADTATYLAKVQAPSYGWKAVVEMIDENGTRAFKAPAATERSGFWSSLNLGQNLPPMDIKFSDALGFKNVKYPIFRARPTVTTFKKLRLRNSGNDYMMAHLRDQFSQSFGDEARLAPAAAETAQVFINGVYRGIMDLREKEDETLIESTFGVDKDSVDYLSVGLAGIKQLSGDKAWANYSGVFNFITGNSMAVAANYAKAKTLLDMENFAHQFALHMFSANGDWITNNVQQFGMPTYDGKWRFRPHDFDTALGVSAATQDMSGYYVRGPHGNVAVPGAPSAVMRALLANPDFKALYTNVIADQLNTVFKFDEASRRLDAMAAPMAPYMAAHTALTGVPASTAQWQTHVEGVRAFLRNRETYYDLHTRSYLGLSARNTVQLAVNDPAMGTVKVNTVDLTSRLTAAAPLWSGKYYPNVPVTLEARPKPGYAFVRWEGSDASGTPVIRPTIAANGMRFTAVFEPVASVAAPVVTPVATQNVLTGVMHLLPLVATDPRNHTLAFSAKGLPPGLDLHPVTGMVSGKPTRAGSYTATVTVSNGKAQTQTAVSWTVSNQGDRMAPLPYSLAGDFQGVGNAAQGMAATQSSTSGTLGAGTAVDGNTAQSKVSTTLVEKNAWWQVDLKAVTPITALVVTSPAGQLSNFHIFVSSTDLTGKTYEQILADPSVWRHQVAGMAASPLVIAAPAGTAGRYVRVQLAGTAALALSEVQVISPSTTAAPINVALRKPAQQSSTSTNPCMVADKAVDGDTNGLWAGCSIAYTNTDANAWWQVDLGAPVALGRIVLWNRTEGTTTRLSNFHVFVSNTQMVGKTYAQLLADPTVWRTAVTGPVSGSLALPAAVTGRYVRVQLAGTDTLSLAEVQVFNAAQPGYTVAVPPPPPAVPVNMALGKPAQQSSTSTNPCMVAAKAVDGNTNGRWSGCSISYTNTDLNAWWQVDLGAPAALSNIVLWNRIEGTTTRLSNFHVFVSNTEMVGRTYAQLLADPTVWRTAVTGPVNVSLALPVAVTGRYVRVQLARTDTLSLAEVQVFNKP